MSGERYSLTCCSLSSTNDFRRPNTSLARKTLCLSHSKSTPKTPDRIRVVGSIYNYSQSLGTEYEIGFTGATTSALAESLITPVARSAITNAPSAIR